MRQTFTEIAANNWGERNRLFQFLYYACRNESVPRIFPFKNKRKWLNGIRNRDRLLYI